MFKSVNQFSSFSANDLNKEKDFYSNIMGLKVKTVIEGALNVSLNNGGHVFIYEKPDHTPATFTVLNFSVDDVEKSVDQLTENGVKFLQYHTKDIETDDKGIFRDSGNGITIAWFKDPAGNILSVLNDK